MRVRRLDREPRPGPGNVLATADGTVWAIDHCCALGMDSGPAELAERLEGVDGDSADAAELLAALFRGMGDEVMLEQLDGRDDVAIVQSGLNITKGVAPEYRDALLKAWCELFVGLVRSQQQLKTVEVVRSASVVRWRIARSVRA